MFIAAIWYKLGNLLQLIQKGKYAYLSQTILLERLYGIRETEVQIEKYVLQN